jgi:hypothetical protein
LARAKKGDVRVLPQLRRLLDLNPHFWQQVSDLTAHAQESWIRLMGGHDLLFRESLLRRVDAMRWQLAGTSPTPMERLLVERAVACWLQVQHADTSAAQNKDASLKQADFAQRRQDRAQKRFLAALGALELTRRLMPSTRQPRALPPSPMTQPASPATERDDVTSDDAICASVTSLAEAVHAEVPSAVDETPTNGHSHNRLRAFLEPEPAGP